MLRKRGGIVGLLVNINSFIHHEAEEGLIEKTTYDNWVLVSLRGHIQNINEISIIFGKIN